MSSVILYSFMSKDPEKSYQDDGRTKRYGIGGTFEADQTSHTRSTENKGNIIEVFKIMKGLEGLNRDDFFEMEVDKRTRGHMLKILKRGARLDRRRYSFSQRVVNNWNALPAEAVSCTTVNSFKGKIAPLIQHIWGVFHKPSRLSDPVSLQPAT